MELVTLKSGVCYPVEAVTLALELEFAGWEMVHEGETLRVLRRVEAAPDLTDAQRESIRAHKPDLLRIVDTVNEIATSDAMSGQVGQKRRRK